MDKKIDIKFGVSKVEHNGLWALVCYRTNELLTDFVYNSIENFSSYYTLATRNHCYGLLKIDGSEIIPCIYASIVEINKETYIVKDKWNYFGVITIMGDILIPVNYKDIKVLSSDSCIRLVVKNDKDEAALFTSYGKRLTGFDYSSIYELLGNKGNGYYKIEKKGSGYCQGVINSRGETIVPCSFYIVIPVLNSSYFIVIKTDNMVGLYNSFGEEIIPCGKYESISCRESDFLCEKDGKIDIYNHKVNLLASDIEIVANSWENNFLVVGNRWEKYKINREGYYCITDNEELIIIPYDYSDPRLLEDGNIVVKERKSGKQGIIDKLGRLVVPVKFDYIRCLSSKDNFYLAIQIGEVLWNDLKQKYYYIYAYNSKLGFCKQVNDDAYTFFQEDWDYSDGLIKVSYCSLEGLINIKGVIIVPLKYQSINANTRYISLKVMTKEGDNYTEVYDKLSHVIVGRYKDIVFNPKIWERWSSWEYNVSNISASIKDDFGWGMVNIKGETIGRHDYINIEYDNYNILCYRKDGYVDFCDRSGRVLGKYPAEQFEEPMVSNDDDDYYWKKVCRDEEEYIYNNGGDWILD